jgi:hypothetical protein
MLANDLNSNKFIGAGKLMGADKALVFSCSV